MNGQVITAYTVEHGGGTFDRDGNPVEPSDGYAVGIARGTAAILPSSASPDQVGDTAYMVMQEYEARFVGTWIMDDGRVAIDPVRILTQKHAALDLALDRGQLAIYGFAEHMAIEVQR